MNCTRPLLIHNTNLCIGKLLIVCSNSVRGGWLKSQGRNVNCVRLLLLAVCLPTTGVAASIQTIANAKTHRCLLMDHLINGNAAFSFREVSWRNGGVIHCINISLHANTAQIKITMSGLIIRVNPNYLDCEKYHKSGIHALTAFPKITSLKATLTIRNEVLIVVLCRCRPPTISVCWIGRVFEIDCPDLVTLELDLFSQMRKTYVNITAGMNMLKIWLSLIWYGEPRNGSQI